MPFGIAPECHESFFKNFFGAATRNKGQNRGFAVKRHMIETPSGFSAKNDSRDISIKKKTRTIGGAACRIKKVLIPHGPRNY